MKPFRLGINMAGAISAGAYTAGVFDFLLDAIRQWELAKKNGDAVPSHSVSIEVLSGASAGGMCSAMGAMSLFDEPLKNATSARLQSAWVNDIDITDLLTKHDLEGGKAVSSLLDSTVLDSIADNRLKWQQPPQPPSFVSPNLTLFLSLTNLRGIPYNVNFAANNFDEQNLYHADQIQFELLSPGAAKKSNLSYQLPTGLPDAPGWTMLRQAALATGAFPVGLQPRVVPRRADEYDYKLWSVSVEGQDDGKGSCACQSDVNIKPAWDTASIVPNPFDTVNVDGGVTNNNPFECARRYLANLSGVTHNPRSPLEADAAVVTIAPFPQGDKFDNKYCTKDKSTLVGMLPDLLSAMLWQSRFQGENLTLLKDPSCCSRFVISPSDDPTNPPTDPLQSTPLGAFGGFLYKDFREHDYELGRRNCQQFLRLHFALPIENPLISAGSGTLSQSVIDSFKAPPSPGDVETKAWIPLIPLCGTARDDVPRPVRSQIPQDALDDIIDKAISRLDAVVDRLSSGNGIFVWIFTEQLKLGLNTKGKSILRDFVIKELQKENSLAPFDGDDDDDTPDNPTG